MADMTPSEIARAMASYIRKHGFSPDYGPKSMDGCGCFLHAAFQIGHYSPEALETVALVAGTRSKWIDEISLRAAGWSRGDTRDAAAACDIAADLLACDEARA